jgi:hypothetical protein
MVKNKVGSVTLGNVCLTEYDEGTLGYSDVFFIQSGPIGFWSTRSELESLHTVLNYYLNIDKFTECEVIVDGEQLSIQ